MHVKSNHVHESNIELINWKSQDIRISWNEIIALEKTFIHHQHVKSLKIKSLSVSFSLPPLSINANKRIV